MPHARRLAIALCFLVPSTPAFTQTAAKPVAAPPEEALGQLVHYPSFLTYDRAESRITGKSIEVASTSFGASGEIPDRYTGPGGSLSPHVMWTPGPTGTKSYVLLFEDGVSNRNTEGTLHWVAFNIPADITSLPEGASVKGSGLRQPIGTMKEGANIDNTASYTGMFGSVSGNNYRMQIFALDRMLDLPNGATRDEVWAAMGGHVLANGEFMAYYRRQPVVPVADWGSAEGLRTTATLVTTVYRAMYLPMLPTIYRPQGQAKGATLSVTAPSFSASGQAGIMPTMFTGRGASISPELNWSKGPKGTKSYLVVFEDALTNTNRDAALHWLAYGIPANVTHLAEGLSSKGHTLNQSIKGMKEGVVDDGSTSYSGPRGIAGAPSFHYHLQVFALDVMPDLPAGATRAQAWQMMKGHVLAKGQTIAFFQPLSEPFASLPPPPRRP